MSHAGRTTTDFMTTENPIQPQAQSEPQAPALRSGDLLGVLVKVEEARKLYGEPEYGYFKQRMQWSPGARRGQAGHYAGSWAECPQDEFEREYDTSRTLEMRRFMKGSNTKEGVRNSYWLYERRLKAPGWVQKLIEALKALEKQATSSPNAVVSHTGALPRSKISNQVPSHGVGL